MVDYVGKICPYCKSEIKEGDEVVVCSVCEMPHHKECWIENKGCTTFGCTGTIMGVDSTNNATDYSNGGYDAAYNQSYNTGYNQSYNTYNQSYSNDELYNIKEEINMIVYENQDYYNKKFEKTVTWNWASAFLGGYWYAYRKMYLMQFIYIVLKFIPGMNVIMFFLSGMFGNCIYKHKVENCARAAKSLEGEAKEKYIQKKRGTSSAAVSILIIINILIVSLSSILWGDL